MKKPTDTLSKKRSGRHDESKTNRYRLLQTLVKVDSHGNPIPSQPKALAKAMVTSGAAAPPKMFTKSEQPNPPDNVLAFRPKTTKPEATTGNEAEKLTPKSEPAEQSLKARANSNVIRTHIEYEKHLYRGWHDRVKKDKVPFAHMGRMYTLQMIEEQRARSISGHQRMKFDTPPSTVHNPMLLDEPKYGGYTGEAPKTVASLNQRNRNRLDPKFYMPPKPGSTTAPSGLPLSAFLPGGKYEPKTSVVYTAVSPPPTPTRDWRSNHDYAAAMRDGTQDTWWRQKAANDSRVQSTWVKKTISYVQWFINHVEPQNWTTYVHNFVTWRDGKPCVNTGEINKASSIIEDALKLHKAMNDSHEREWKMLDSALTDAHSEINLLKQELALTQEELRTERQANSLMEYDIAQRNGEDPDNIRQAYVGKIQDPPEDADEMIAQYNTYNSFVRVDGPEHAFARYFYGDPSLGQVIRDHADMRAAERVAEMEGREFKRHMSKFFNDLGNYGREQYINWWKKEYPKLRRHKLRSKRSSVVAPTCESVALAALSRKAKPRTHRSLYYSSLEDRKPVLNNAVAGAILQRIQPAKQCFNNPALVVGDYRETWFSDEHHRAKYEQWWRERIDGAEMLFYEKTQPGKVALVKGINKTIGLLNTELNPISRKRQKKLLAKMREERQHRDEMREQRKEERERQKKLKAEKDHIRKMQRIAY